MTVEVERRAASGKVTARETLALELQGPRQSVLVVGVQSR